MIDKENFKKTIMSKKEGEIAIPFEDVDIDLESFVKTDGVNPEVLTVITSKQDELVDLCKEVPGCNWSVGYVQDEERDVMIVKWWFNEQDFPVEEAAV